MLIYFWLTTYFLKGHPAVTEKVLDTETDELAVTRMNATELLFGAYNSAQPGRNLQIVRELLRDFTIIEFDAEASEHFARQKACLKKAGILIADMDLMIASICLAGKHVLVSNNVRHFERITELPLENWADAGK